MACWFIIWKKHGAKASVLTLKERKRGKDFYMTFSNFSALSFTVSAIPVNKCLCCIIHKVYPLHYLSS